MTKPWRQPARILLPALLLCSLPALAQDEVLLAEQERLQKELQTLVAREAWEGVERTYRQLLDLEAQGIAVTYAEHMLGAQAAQQRGDVVATRQRLEAALEQWSTELARNWLADINASFGQVSISVPARNKLEYTLQIEESPFEPERRFAIEFAQTTLNEERGFEGYLPTGSYTIGEQTFSVAPGRRAVVEVGAGQRPTGPAVAEETEEPEEVEEPEVKPPREPREGGVVSGRLRLGVGYGRAGTPSAGIQPASFGGASPRLGLGAGIAASEVLGIGLEAGWMGAFSSPDRLNMVYGSAALEVYLDDITIGLGPMLAGGRGEITGLDAEAVAAYCAEQTDNSCGGLELGQEAGTALSGSIRAVGPALSGGYTVLESGALQGDAMLLLTALSDGSRWYPMAQVGVQMAVGGAR